MGKMAARAVSPGGALLRSSRLFSLPRAIPDKQVPYELRIVNPESSTKPHPTHQTITSPQTSREKGDWGLKRPLPLKQTMATSTPLLKVRQLDSTERITDYGSSADHALTLEKFNELNMSITVPRPTHKIDGAKTAPRMSAFEEAYDFTVAPEEDPERKGWKFSGPWLASMPEGEFDAFIKQKVLPRRMEFRQVMRTKLANEMTLENNRSAREDGRDAPPPIQTAEVTNAQLGQYMRSLRHQRAKLYRFVTNFLDLPPLHIPVGLSEAMNIPTTPSGSPNMLFDAQGPPPSHPSAGLSYLRTHSFMENHFLYGPQEQKKPVLARMLQPQFGRKPVMLGVGGFVTEAPGGMNEANIKKAASRKATDRVANGIQHLDIQTHGGAKAWVVPERAYIDPNGMVVLKVVDARDETRLVAIESRGRPVVYNSSRTEVNLEEQEREAARYDRTAEMLTETADEETETGKDVMGSASAYGLDEPQGTPPS